jgi:hypothetical protein
MKLDLPITSPLDIAECRRRIRNLIESVPHADDDAVYVGAVDEDDITLIRQPVGRRGFPPYLVARLELVAEGTQLQGDFRINPFFRLVLALWFAVAAWMAVSAFFGDPAFVWQRLELPAWMMVVAIVLIGILRWRGRHDERATVRTLAEQLEARRDDAGQ